MTLEIDCSQCAKCEFIEIDQDELPLEVTLAAIIAANAPEWIVEQNGTSLDLYCSRRCAE